MDRGHAPQHGEHPRKRSATPAAREGSTTGAPRTRLLGRDGATSPRNLAFAIWENVGFCVWRMWRRRAVPRARDGLTRRRVPLTTMPTAVAPSAAPTRSGRTLGGRNGRRQRRAAARAGRVTADRCWNGRVVIDAVGRRGRALVWAAAISSSWRTSTVLPAAVKGWAPAHAGRWQHSSQQCSSSARRAATAGAAHPD